MKTRTLVTGATGLIGRHLVPMLRSAGRDVITTSLHASSADEPSVDLRSAAAAQALIARTQPSVIVHLAGAVAGDVGALYAGNVLTTRHVLEHAATLAVPPFVIVLGSAAEYGDGGGARIHEATPLAPVSNYGRAKAAQTTLALDLAERTGLPLLVLRPFNIVAADLPDTAALGRITRAITAAGDSSPRVTIGRIDIVRDYVPLDAVTRMILAIIDSRPAHRVVNVCSGVGLVLGDILTAIADEAGVRPEFVVDPQLAALPAAPAVIGDASLTTALLGAPITVTPRSIARLMLGR